MNYIMSFRQINTTLSFRKLLLFILFLAIGIQVIIITYNHFSGYYVLSGMQHFLLRLLRGILLSIAGGFLIAYPDLFFISYLNKVAPWGIKLIKRIVLQFLFAIALAIIISFLVTLFANFIKPYTEGLQNVIINNALIYGVVNILTMAILEGWISFIEERRARQLADNLQAELSQIRFEVLKSQINPHFMFNSLNVLSGLIDKDINKAQLFIDEFSSIYRYVLETIEQPVASLGKELDFARSYLFLQQIRYGKNLSYSINISADLLNMMLPPLSLQVVLENATKHNIINEVRPLKIEILNEGFLLVVKNDIQPKISQGRSTGLGLKNLMKRYSLITRLTPEFTLDTSYYIAKLPLINPDQNESIDN
jgi:two-component system, LytTR family, sensor kinase